MRLLWKWYLVWVGGAALLTVLLFVLGDNCAPDVLGHWSAKPHLPNTQEWPLVLCLKLLVLETKASGAKLVAETVLANDSLRTLRDFANAWRDWAVSSRKRLNCCRFVLSSWSKAEGSGFESTMTGPSRAGLAVTHASRSDFAAITDPHNFPEGRCTGNPSSYSYRWTVRTAFPK